MTYAEAYDAVLAQLKRIGYPVHEIYSQTLTRPCVAVEAFPGNADTLNADGRMNHLRFVVTFLPQLDERHNVKDQRDVMRFCDAVLELFSPRGLPGITCQTNPAGRSLTECYVNIEAQFSHAPVVDSGLPMMEDIHFTITTR